VNPTLCTRRFIHPDGRWVNITAKEGQVVQISGTEGATVPYFGGVTEETFAPREGRSADQEMEEMAQDFGRQKYAEMLPSQKAEGETNINGLWRRFENWLCERTPVFCRWPLAPGASEAEVEAFESVIGAKLPDDVRQSYLRHNGSAGVRLLSVVGEGKWVTLEEAAKCWEFFQKIPPDLEAEEDRNTPLGPMKKVASSAGWIPISDNSGGDHLCVDLDPAEGGNIGQLFSYWHEYGAWRLVAPSFTVFLERLLGHLDQGKYAINDEGQLAPVNGPEPEDVSKVQDYFLAD
jgi:cell wall assembly regulator SMI1